ncbi:LysR family transcriptional regulator [Bradyrhizobium sp. 14AA]
MRCHRLDLNLLLVLDRLLKTRNLSRVAGELNLTPSAISNALARLRIHFDDELLVQSGRKMVPTRLALQMTGSIDDLVARARALALTRAEFDPETSQRTFSVVTNDYTASLLLADVVKQIGAISPRISIAHVPMPDLRERPLDAFDVLLGSNVAFDAEVSTATLWEETFVPVVWAGNTDVQEPLSLATVAACTHVSALLDERLSVPIVDHFFQSKGVHRTKSICLQSLLLLPEFVVGTSYMAILPLRLARRRAQDLPLRLLQADFELPRISEKLQWPTYLNRDPANVWLRNMIRASATQVEAP